MDSAGLVAALFVPFGSLLGGACPLMVVTSCIDNRAGTKSVFFIFAPHRMPDTIVWQPHGRLLAFFRSSMRALLRSIGF
jgi:hypothetical protein